MQSMVVPGPSSVLTTPQPENCCYIFLLASAHSKSLEYVLSISIVVPSDQRIVLRASRKHSLLEL
jgi:hypothetical protein